MKSRAVAALLGAVLVSGPLALPAAAFGSQASLFRIADARIAEASGIAPGRVSPGVVYLQNDSGDTNRFFALDVRSGATAATVAVSGARNVDWEDIAVGPDARGRSSVWLADIGDNAAGRDEVQVYRVPEPRLRSGQHGAYIRTATADVWRLRYPSGPVDAESFAVTRDGNAYIFTKTLGTSTVYRLPARPDAAHVQTLRRVGQVVFLPTGTTNPFGLPGQLTATGASISADGELLVVRTYADAYVWRLTDGDVAGALRGPPVREALPRQPQGEGICVRAGRLLLSSEGVHSAVVAVPVPPGLPPTGVPSGAGSPSGSIVPSGSVGSSRAAGSSGHSPWLLPVMGAAAAVLLGATWFGLRRRH